MSNAPLIERYVGVPLLRLHDAVYQKTNGRIGHRFPGVPPSLLLHTIGAKTGQTRTTSLTYARDNASYLVVASNGGQDRAPGWYYNIRADPQVEINVGPKRFPVTATVLSDADDPDYTRLWHVVNGNNQNRYAGYQKRTARTIPIVVLTPR